MPYEVHLANPLAGIALNSADEGENVRVIASDFATDEQGGTFYDYLDNLERLFLKPYLGTERRVSMIDHCLVLMDKQTNKATVYVNELEMVQEVVWRREVAVGEYVTEQDIGGILSLNFNNVPIPNQCAIIFYFSVGWKRGIFFDFRPNVTGYELENINKKLAEHNEALQFYKISSVNKETWDKLVEFGWFPFVSLLGSQEFNGLVSRFCEGKPIDKREDLVIETFSDAKILAVQAKFRQLEFLKHHIPFLEAGIERYLAGDYISSISTIWPRIEGILRYAYTGSEPRPNQRELTDNIKDIVANQSIAPSIFFPEEFRKYLKNFYFRDFDIQTGQLDVSRHSIGHGVSAPETYRRLYALLGILIIDQLTYYLTLRKPQKSAN